MASLAKSTHFENLSNVGQDVTNGKTHVSKIVVTNASVAPAFVQVFDSAAANVVLGTTKPLFTIPCSATAGFTSVNFSHGWLVDFSVSVFSTTTPTGSSGSAPGVFLQAWVS